MLMLAFMYRYPCLCDVCIHLRPLMRERNTLRHITLYVPVQYTTHILALYAPYSYIVKVKRKLTTQ